MTPDPTYALQVRGRETNYTHWIRRQLGTLAETAEAYQEWRPYFPRKRWCFVILCRNVGRKTVQYPAEVLFGDE
jgi:hypothetical protein